MRLTTQGIVLRETNYKEADKILTVLTRDWGKRTVKARGCRRKNSKLTAASQLLVYSELTLSERGEFTTLTARPHSPANRLRFPATAPANLPKP